MRRIPPSAPARGSATLEERLALLPGAIVAFSGGVDSTVLLHACRRALGGAVVAVTARSPSLPAAELAEARALATELGVRHVVLDTNELDRAEYVRNDLDRCYHCKSELFDVIERWRARGGAPEGWPVLLGVIADDLGDHRPGLRAARERGARTPLADAGFDKEAVRSYARAHGLAVAEKPQAACLASRIPFGEPVTRQVLAQVERAEARLRTLGFGQVRVRHHGDVARIEVDPAALVDAVRRREAILEAVRAAGYVHVALDLAGYRSGSLHEAST